MTITWAVSRLLGPTTSFSSTGKLISVSMARLACFVAVQAFRIAIACALCYGGSKFIGFSISLKDLILNCIALTVRRSHGRTVLTATQHLQSTDKVLTQYSHSSDAAPTQFSQSTHTVPTLTVT